MQVSTADMERLGILPYLSLRVDQFLRDAWPDAPIVPKKRVYRFLEEALELAQAMGVTEQEAETLLRYTFGRPIGEVQQEFGGTVFTLVSVGNSLGLDFLGEGHASVDEAYGRIDKIREKDKTKPKVAA